MKSTAVSTVCLGTSLLRVQYMCVQLYTQVLCVQIVHTSVITKYFYITSMGLRETEISL